MDINLGLRSWLIPQIALFVMYYGFGRILPWWVLWFPTLVVGILMFLVVFVVLFVVFIVYITNGDNW